VPTSFNEVPPQDEPPEPPRVETGGIGGERFLIVEDEPLVALLLADALEEAGGTIVGTAAPVEEALRYIESEKIDAGLLDCNLNGRAIDEVASALSCRGVPFLFVSGYGQAGKPRDFADAPVLGKPFTHVQLMRATEALVRQGIRSPV